MQTYLNNKLLGLVLHEFLLGSRVFSFVVGRHAPESVDLGRKQDDLLFIVLALGLVSEGFLELLLQFFVLGTGYLELVGQFVDRSRRQPQVLLDPSNLIGHRSILGHQFLNLDPVGLRLVVVLADPALHLGQFPLELGLRSAGQPQRLLSVLHLFTQANVFGGQFVDLPLQRFVFLVVEVYPLLVLVDFLDHLGILIGRESQILLS